MKEWIRIVDANGRRFAVMIFKPVDIECYVIEVFFKPKATAEPQVWHEDYESQIDAEERFWEIGSEECLAILTYFQESELQSNEDYEQYN